jgi:hypothetical protein
VRAGWLRGAIGGGVGAYVAAREEAAKTTQADTKEGTPVSSTLPAVIAPHLQQASQGGTIHATTAAEKSTGAALAVQPEQELHLRARQAMRYRDARWLRLHQRGVEQGLPAKVKQQGVVACVIRLHAGRTAARLRGHSCMTCSQGQLTHLLLCCAIVHRVQQLSQVLGIQGTWC